MEFKTILLEEIQKITQEQNILEDILSNGNLLNEGVDFNSVLQKVKAYAQKGLLTATVLAGLMSSNAFSQQQKTAIQNIAQTSIAAPQQSVNITPPLRTEWNKFIDWIGQNYPNGISDWGADPTAQIVNAYKAVNPNSPITPTNVKDFQQDLVSYNNKWKTLQPNYHEKGPILSKPSPIDNRIGSITSKMKFPTIVFEYNGKITNFGTDIETAMRAFEENQENAPYVDPDLTPQQRFQRNQELRAQGKAIPTVGDIQRQQQQNTLAGTK